MQTERLYKYLLVTSTTYNKKTTRNLKIILKKFKFENTLSDKLQENIKD